VVFGKSTWANWRSSWITVSSTMTSSNDFSYRDGTSIYSESDDGDDGVKL
jgi:hypothetical protein